jgi:hypothetical protein
MRRTLSETLVELAESTQPLPEIAPWLRVTGLTLDLPIEIALRRLAGEAELLADAPRWRWRTPFDEVPGRLRITWEENLNL